jgi:hypothetical protein
MNDGRLVLALDFDGVLHSYASGWRGAGIIQDPPVPGAIDFVREALRHFRVCIFSSRCVDEESAWYGACRIFWSKTNLDGVKAMVEWFRQHGLTDEEIAWVEFWGTKPPAHVLIDDRAHAFKGKFPSIAELKAFKPWNKR